MADTSERIIILSAVVLVIILWIPNSGLIQTIVTIDDLEVEIDTSRDNYTISEGFTATIYLVNSRSRDVWMNPIGELQILGRSVNDPEPNTGYKVLGFPHAQLIHIPPKSKLKLFERGFVSQYSGDFVISCFGAEKTVLILDSVFEGDPIQAKMNKYSFKNSEKASLKITNNTPDTITLGDRYEIQKKEGDSWVEVPPSLFHPEIWDLIAYIVDSGASLSQQISIEMLEAGQYRISKDVHSDVPREYLFTIIVEFEIQEFLEKEYAWVTATILTVEPSPTLNILELSSEDSDIPRSLFEAIDKALPEDETMKEGEQIRDVPTGRIERIYPTSIAEATSLIHYFGDEIEEDRLYYEFYVSYIDYMFSILIQFHLPDTTSFAPTKLNTTKYYSYSNLTVTPASIVLGENLTISLEITNILPRRAEFPYAIHVETPDYSYVILASTFMEGYETKTLSHIEVPEVLGTYIVSLGEMDVYCTVEPSSDS